jgi:hypothetical protein
MPNIVIVGAGQIGSRHLQSLAHIRTQVRIQVLDSSSESLGRAKERYQQVVQGIKSPYVEAVEYFSNWNDIAPTVDLGIIATTADCRRQITERLLGQRTVKNLILEKVVFQCEEDFVALSRLFAEKKTRVWVNCPMRTWTGYRALRETGIKQLLLSVSGSGWGLACNTVHYLDLFSYLTGDESYPTVLSIDGLDPGSILSKRPGFIEITGTLSGVSSAGAAHLTSWRTGSAPVSVSLTTPLMHCTIRQDLQKMWISEAESSWTVREESFPIPFQSQLTHIVAQGILNESRCDLTEFSVSWRFHTPLLKAIASHLNGLEPCPIT